MGVSLQKGQKVDLTKNNAGLKNVLVGLGWDTNKYDGGQDFDLDATVFLLGPNGKVTDPEKDMIFYNQRQNTNGSVIHSGDNRTGYGEGDDERVKIQLDKVPSNIDKLAFVITIHDAAAKGQNFGQVSNAYVRVLDEKSNRELIRYYLGEDYSVETALVTGELYRNNGEWKFAAVGRGFQGGLYAMCKNYGVDVEEPAQTTPQYNNNNSNNNNSNYNNNYYAPSAPPYSYQSAQYPQYSGYNQYQTQPTATHTFDADRMLNPPNRNRDNQRNLI